MKTGDRNNNGIIMWIHNKISYRTKDQANRFPSQLNDIQWVKSKNKVSAANNEFTVVLDPDGPITIYRSQDGIADTTKLESLATFHPKGL